MTNDLIICHTLYRTATHSHVVHLLKGSGSDPTLLVSSNPPVIEQPVAQDEREMLLAEDKKKHAAAFKEKVLFHLLVLIL